MQQGEYRHVSDEQALQAVSNMSMPAKTRKK